MGPYNILLDCGMADTQVLTSSDRPPADFAFCSHAHPDHARGLWALHQAYPDLPIYTSEVTARLMGFNWPSQETPDFCQPVPWRSPILLAPQLTLEIWPAGHLPGASVVALTYEAEGQTYRVIYTGDLTLSNSRLVDGFPLDELRNSKPDVLIIEGSYGTARHPRRRQQENDLAAKIHQSLSHKRSVLLPTSILGMGQEILMLLRSHHHFTGREVNIWMNDIVARACDAYLDLLNNFPATVQNFAKHQALFWDERIRPYVRPLSQATPELLSTGLNIVITESTADLEACCDLYPGPWLLLLPERPGQLGSIQADVQTQIESSERFHAGITSGQIALDSYLLSDHCDGAGTLQVIHNIRPQHVIFVHGSPAYLTDLTSVEDLQTRYHLHLPAADTSIELPTSDTFIQPEPPNTHFGGELTELHTAVLVTLDQAITAEPRWQKFADTGIVEARWQGDELILRGLQQREILSDVSSSDSAQGIIVCCDTCAYYRGQRCCNQKSALFGFHVTPEGSCPVYQPAYEEG
ncbi:MAG: MBL fold metallo-hydrolase [Elainellaceae cyanobacterium]